VLFTRSLAKLSLHFSDFLRFYRHFKRFSKKTLLLEIHFKNEVPGTFLSLTDMPLVHNWDPGKIWGLAIGSLDQFGGAARRISRLRRRIRPGRWWSSTTCSPRTWWRPKLGRRGRRRGRAAAAGGRGCGGLRFHREGSNAGQCAT
jgi:hypothetical protein